MKKIIVISDTHGNRMALNELYDKFLENDLILFLGDGLADMEYLKLDSYLKDKIISVSGNCDMTNTTSTKVIEIEGVKILMTHGHEYSVKTDLDNLVEKAKQLACDIALYGHTHIPKKQNINGVLTINPGNIKGLSGSRYCYLVIHNKKVTSVLVN